jgi:hypothetical protein
MADRPGARQARLSVRAPGRVVLKLPLHGFGPQAARSRVALVWVVFVVPALPSGAVSPAVRAGPDMMMEQRKACRCR